MNFKKFYSKYYNLIYKNKNYEDEANYIINLLKIKKLKIKKILELGAGTGAHAKYFFKKGFSIVCVEKSKEMIKNFQIKSKRVEIINTDLKKLKLQKKFDLVLSMFHVVNYMVKQFEINLFFNAASKHLNKGGILIFDTWYYPSIRHSPLQKTKKLLSDNFFKIIREGYPFKVSKKIFDIKYCIEVINLKNLNNYTFTEKHRVRAFDIQELDKIAKKYDFKQVANYAFLKYTKPNKNSFAATMIYKKL